MKHLKEVFFLKTKQQVPYGVLVLQDMMGLLA